MKKEPLIFYDGVCNLCNNAVRFILKRDKKGTFFFVSLQSDKVHSFLPPDFHNDYSSFLLLQNGRLYSESDAVLHVCKQLSGGWPLLYGFIVVPAFIRNGIYRFISKNRYRWFGKKDSCFITTPALNGKFLND